MRGDDLKVIYSRLDTRFIDLFYKRGSIASYASAGIARAEMSVCLPLGPSVRLTVRHTLVLYQNETS